ncbi:MAG: acyl-CoA dehydrogenase family protein, partial [Novosphingobium sp.]
KHRCADMAVLVEAGRATSYVAVWNCAEDSAERAQTASAAKAYCADIARDACNEAIQIHGGMGFTWEMALHRYLRRAKVLESAFGNPAWHYRRVHAEAVAGREADATACRDAA